MMAEERFQAAGGVASAGLGEEETALFDQRTQKIFTLNDTGRAIWERLQAGPATLPELAAAVEDEFEVQGPEAETAVREFLEELVREGLVERKG